MYLLRIALTPVALLILISGCAGSAQRDLVQALAEVGCGGVPAVEYQRMASGVVLSVSVQECVGAQPRRTGELVGRDEAARAVGRAMWSTPTHRFDSVMVTVYRTAEDPDRTRPQSVVLERDQLAAVFGPRDPALDSPLPLDDDGGRAAWRYLPPLAAVGGIMLVAGMARALRAGRVLPVLIIRR
ncbi:hypothetical protein [Pseudonocardia broussonetiae]|uniref:DUF3153 domain-containing protein n=1 Tax=Pseudonocardia broussonetiae TaxID=2736640 RepID=A0A6M6JNB3_9PSEU|nr:hypothetical protein [Pseudonocardia broussonetiae]QJY47801.1 hypothetical protein HOP40_19925 [Pseudonocardia broussonetiae]